MKTAAINPAIAAITGTTAKTAQPDTSFNDVLTREVASRQTAAEVPHAARSRNSDSAGRTSASSAANDQSSERNAPAVPQSSPVNDAAVARTGENPELPAEKEAAMPLPDEETSFDTASTELLAMVASMSSMAMPQTAASDSAAAEIAPAVDANAYATSRQSSQPDLVNTAGTALPAIAEDGDAAIGHPALATADTASATGQPADTDNLTAAQSGAQQTATTIQPAAFDQSPRPVSQETGVVKSEPGDAASRLDKAGSTPQEGVNTPVLRPEASAAANTGTGQALVLEQRTPDAPALPTGLQAVQAASTGTELHDAVTQVTPPAVAATAMPTAIQQAAPTAPAGSANHLMPLVDTPEWGEALGQKVVWMVSSSQQSASLTLNPPDLGPLKVVLSVNNNHATAHFTAAQPEVRQALENSMPRLREMLGDAGIQLGQANVSAGTPNDQENRFAQQPSGNRSSHGGDHDQIADSAPVSALHAERNDTVRSGQGLVDTFV